MKVPPKRKGNSLGSLLWFSSIALNESPSEKEGKSAESASDELLKAAALNESPSEKEGKCSDS